MDPPLVNFSIGTNTSVVSAASARHVGNQTVRRELRT
jgi:hypothetical protein